MEVVDDIATFPNGLKLRVNPAAISHQAVNDAAGQFPEPAVPTVTVTQNGQPAVEENPDDPVYQAARIAARDSRAWAVVKSFIIMGTKLEQAPAGVPGIDDEEAWETLAYTKGVTVPTNRFERYDMWLRYRGFEAGYIGGAREGLQEYTELLKYLAVQSGMTLEAPSAIVATFRDNPERPPDPTGDAVASAGDGDGGRHASAAGLGY